MIRTPTASALHWPAPFVSVMRPMLVALVAGCASVQSHGGEASATRDLAVAVSAHAGADSAAMRRDIAWLSSDALEGRGTGTAGNDSASAFIARRYRALGLAPVPAPGKTDGYFQPFVARPAARTHATAAPGGIPTRNVVAMVPGTDRAVRDEYVVVGAHFDHLGRDGSFATDPENKDAIRNGADDNASGTAGVLEMARLFARNPARRSVVFVNFTAEELGLLGSREFVKTAPVPVDRMRAMINFDMIGRLKDERLIVYGVATATEMSAIVDSAAQGLGFRVAAQGDGAGPSDHATFYEAGLPVLHFFTDLHDDYHRASDDAEKINAAGAARVVTMAERVVRTIANRPAPLTFVRVPVAASTMTSRSGSDAYLGSVPDMAAGDAPGLRLSSVRAGSPAEKGGLKAGDLIVEFGGVKVTDLYTYTDALYAHKPGDTVKVVVVRGSERVTLEVTLGKRGQ